MTDAAWEAANLLDVLGDSLCRRALVVASGSPVPATTLADQLDVSPPTVYRRVDSLVAHGLLCEHRRVDADGNHYRTFETTVDRVEVAFVDGGYEVSVGCRQDLGDQFDEFWTEFTASTPGEVSGRGSETTGTDSGDSPSPL